MSLTEHEHQSLREQYARLRNAATRVRDAARDGGTAGGTPDGESLALVPTHLLRILDNELRGEPQASTFFTMSVS